MASRDRAIVTAEIFLLGLLAIPYWMVREVLALRWDPRRVNLRRFWDAVWTERGR